MSDRNSSSKCLARQLRRNQTDAERLIWSRLRNRRLSGAKFRRQYPIGHYIVDFCCRERRLVVELDGGHHVDNAQVDQRRTEVLIQHGYRVLRFWNYEVLADIETVLQAINTALNHPHPHPLPGRERGND